MIILAPLVSCHHQFRYNQTQSMLLLQFTFPSVSFPVSSGSPNPAKLTDQSSSGASLKTSHQDTLLLLISRLSQNSCWYCNILVPTITILGPTKLLASRLSVTRSSRMFARLCWTEVLYKPSVGTLYQYTVLCFSTTAAENLAWALRATLTRSEAQRPQRSISRAFLI
jgi:hypothetical protein